MDESLPRIESHGMRHFFDVCTDFFAQIGDDVCITDFQSEERIRRVLNELGAVDGGDEEFSLVAWRAGPIMHGAKETPLENGTVDSRSSAAEEGSSTPTTMRSGWKKSATAVPSRRNSGFEATRNFKLLFLE